MSRNRIFLLAAVSLGLVAGIWLFFAFVFRATVVVTGDGSQITITTLAGDAVASGDSASYHVSPGEYRVTVTNGEKQASYIVSLSAFQAISLDAGAGQPQYASIAVLTPLNDVLPAGQTLIGHNPVTEKLVRVDAQGRSTDQLTIPVPFSNNRDWEAEIPGRVDVYQTYHNKQALVASGGGIYVLGNGRATDIDTSAVSEGWIERDVMIGANAAQESFVVAYRGSIYLYASPSAKPEKVYTSPKKFDRVVYGGDKVLLYSTILPDTADNVRGSYQDYAIDALLVDLKTKQEVTIGGPITNATLNTDGTFATIKLRGEQPYLYEISTQRRAATIDQYKGALPYWTSANNYLYYRGGVLWRYDIAAKRSESVASIPVTVTSISQDGEGGYFASYYTRSDKAGIYHVTAAKPPAGVARLQEITPRVAAEYTITFSALGTPTVIIQTRAPLNGAGRFERYKAETLQLRQQALDYLKQNGVDLTGITVKYSPDSL